MTKWILSSFASLAAFAALLTTSFHASAATITTSYGTVAGADDANQAGPNWGQSIKPDVGASPAGPNGMLYITSMEFQTSSSTLGPAGQVYLHVYDDFVTDSTGAITSIGNLVAVSTNALEMASLGLNATAHWAFAGNVGLNAASEYMFVTALDTNPATVGDHTNFGNGGQWELNVGDPYLGGRAYRQNGGNTDWDMEFRATFSSVPVPEPASLALTCSVLFACFALRRPACCLNSHVDLPNSTPGAPGSDATALSSDR